MFPGSFLNTTYEVDHPWDLSSHGYFLGFLSSNFSIYATLSNAIRAWCGWRIINVTLDIEVFKVCR